LTKEKRVPGLSKPQEANETGIEYQSSLGSFVVGKESAKVCFYVNDGFWKSHNRIQRIATKMIDKTVIVAKAQGIARVLDAQAWPIVSYVESSAYNNEDTWHRRVAHVRFSTSKIPSTTYCLVNGLDIYIDCETGTVLLVRLVENIKSEKVDSRITMSEATEICRKESDKGEHGDDGFGKVMTPYLVGKLTNMTDTAAFCLNWPEKEVKTKPCYVFKAVIAGQWDDTGRFIVVDAETGEVTFR